jgi:signal transduction histidine kinase
MVRSIDLRESEGRLRTVTTVLLVEDNPADARLARDMLAGSATPFQVAHVAHLSDALDYLADHEIAVILLDLSLPDAHGLAALARFHAVAPRVPIVVMSGNDDEALAVAAVREGAQDYLVKGRVESGLLARALRYAIERKRAETQLAEALTLQREANAQLGPLNKIKSDFVSIVGHEFRTPLTSIQGFSEIIRDEELTREEVTEYAADINAEAQRLSRLIDDMLDLDRMESGRLVLHRAPVDLNTLITEVAGDMRPSAPLHLLRLDLGDALPPLSGDRDKLRQVLTNLLSNAVKYSPEGGEITLSSRVEGTCVHLRVQDHGVGIPTEALEAIFERYARIDSEATRSIQGTGLGLPIVRRIVALHGGAVWAESAPGQGAVFHVTIPLAAAAAAA